MTVLGKQKFCMAMLVLTCLAGPLKAADPLDHLDPQRYGAGTLIAAIEELAGYYPDQAVDLLLPLLGHPDQDVSRSSAWLLRRMGRSSEGVGSASAVLADLAASVESRTAAALALAELKSASAQAPLQTALASDTEAQVRTAAARALGELYRPGAADTLSAALATDDDENVRAAAACAMGKVPDANAPAIMNALQDSHFSVRLEAAWALGRPQFRDAQGIIGNLLRALQSDSDCRVQAAAAWALGELGDPTVKDALVAAQNGPCRLTAQAAARANGEIE